MTDTDDSLVIIICHRIRSPLPGSEQNDSPPTTPHQLARPHASPPARTAGARVMGPQAQTATCSKQHMPHKNLALAPYLPTCLGGLAVLHRIPVCPGVVANASLAPTRRRSRCLVVPVSQSLRSGHPVSAYNNPGGRCQGWFENAGYNRPSLLTLQTAEPLSTWGAPPCHRARKQGNMGFTPRGSIPGANRNNGRRGERCWIFGVSNILSFPLILVHTKIPRPTCRGQDCAECSAG